MSRHPCTVSTLCRACTFLILLLCCFNALAQATNDTSMLMDWGKDEPGIPPAITRNVTPKRTAELLGAAMASSKSESARVAYVHDLAGCRAEDTIPFLEAALEDPSPLVRAEAIRIAAELNRAELKSAMMRTLSDQDPRVRREAILSGIQQDAEHASSREGEFDLSLKSAAIHAASSPTELQSLASGLPQLPRGLKLEAIERLSNTASTWAAAQLSESLSGEVDERILSIRALAKLDATNQWERIRPFLSDPHGAVRREATLAISKLAPPSDRAQLAAGMLSDGSEWVRQAAATVLIANPSASSIVALTAQLESSTPELHDASRDALVSIGQPVVKHTVGLLTDSRARGRIDGSYILGRLRSENGLDVHMALLADPDLQVAAQAADSLGRIGNAAAAPALRRLISLLAESPVGRTSTAFAEAMIACGRLGDRAALYPAIQHLSDGTASPLVRAACAFAIGRLSDGSSADLSEALLARYRDREESPQVQFEALKALGQAKFLQSTDALRSISSEEFDPELRWIAHWSLERIVAGPIPYSPPEHKVISNAVISDIVGSTDGPRVDARLLLGGYALPEAWLPVEVTLTNPGDVALSGWIEVIPAEIAGIDLFKTACTVPSHSTARYTLYVRFSSTASSANDSNVGIAQLRSAAGGIVARSPLVGSFIAPSKGTQSAGSLLLRIHDPDDSREADDGDERDVTTFARWLSPVLNTSLQATSIPVGLAPRQRIGYDGCPIVLLDGVDLDTLDHAQRNAIFEHIIAGGVVLLCAPGDKAPLLHTWLGPYLPVYPVAQRTATDITSHRSGHRFAMRTRTAICEATAAESGAFAVLEDDGFVHAAYSRLGLGRIVFTSFPINALDTTDVEAEALWKLLLRRSTVGADGQDLTALARNTLGGMMGSATPSWTFAAVVACSYLALILASVFGLFCGDRIRSFGMAAAVALFFSFGVFVWAGLHQRATTFSQARWTLTDVGTHGALRTEYVSWYGAPSDGISLAAINEHTSIDPREDSAIVRAEVSMMPLAVEFSQSGGGGAPPILRAEATDRSTGIVATARFTSAGLALKASNQLALPLRSPALLWHQQIPLGQIPPGDSDVPISVNEPPPDNQPGSLQGVILTSLMENLLASSDAPRLTGWLDHDSQDELLKIDARGTRATSQQSLHLVRVPVQLETPAPGSDVLIDGIFNSIVLLQREGCPYDPMLRRWLPSAQSGQWLLGFKPPAAVGRLKPIRVVLELSAAAPRQRIEIRAGQCAGGVPRPNPVGPVIAEWNAVISRQTVSLHCTENDADSDGCVWLLLTVDSPPASSPASWLIHSLQLTYEARAVGLSD